MSISAQIAQARVDYFTHASPPLPESLGTIGGGEAPSPSFHDVLAAINPLNHIPIVSDLLSSPGETESSTLSRVVEVAGSTLLGGPIGFIASLASMAFEGATGQTPVQAIASAVMGGPTEIAQANAPKAAVETAQADTPQNTAELAALAQAEPAPRSKQNTILELYGASPASAHESYRQAQLRPYLTDVTVSRVL